MRGYGEALRTNLYGIGDDLYLGANDRFHDLVLLSVHAKTNYGISDSAMAGFLLRTPDGCVLQVIMTRTRQVATSGFCCGVTVFHPGPLVVAFSQVLGLLAGDGGDDAGRTDCGAAFSAQVANFARQSKGDI